MKNSNYRYLSLIMVFVMAVNMITVPKPVNAEQTSGIMIELEENPFTHHPYTGIVCGLNEGMQVKLSFPGIENGSLKVKPPKLGKFQGDALRWNDTIKLVNNTAVINYIPPDYLGEWQLKEQDPQTLKWYTLDTLAFTFLDADENEQEISIDIRLYRPPIIMVYGFTGDDNIWSNCSQYLDTEKFDTLISNTNGETLQVQVQNLQQSIKIKKDEYSQQDIKIEQADIIAHGMGGLTSRFYVESFSQYKNDVRKIIMLGTPNHGLSLSDLEQGSIRSNLLTAYAAAAQLLDKKSSFLEELNRGEALGNHLNPDIEYGNIYSHSPYPGYFAGDMLVPAASAYLNGAQNYQVSGDVHTAVFPGTAMAEDSQVWEIMNTWLNQTIYRPETALLNIEVSKTEGDVTVRKWTAEEVEDIPIKAEAFTIRAVNDIYTDDGRIILRFMNNGTTWAYVYLDSNTEISLNYVSPPLIEIKINKGNVRFNTLKEGGHFSVIVQGDDNIPKISLTDRDTDFVVSFRENIEVFSFTGQVFAGVMNLNNEMDIRTLKSNSGITLTGDRNIKDLGAVSDLWYQDEFYQFTYQDKAREFFAQVKAKALIQIDPIMPWFNKSYSWVTQQVQNSNKLLAPIFYKIQQTFIEKFKKD